MNPDYVDNTLDPPNHDDSDTEEYRNFLCRLLSDEMEDDELEEDYNPDQTGQHIEDEEGGRSEEDEDDDCSDDDEDNCSDDEYDDDEFNGSTKVGKREVQELVDGCWKTILGETPHASDIGIDNELTSHSSGNPFNYKVFNESYFTDLDQVDCDVLSVSSDGYMENVNYGRNTDNKNTSNRSNKLEYHSSLSSSSKLSFHQVHQETNKSDGIEINKKRNSKFKVSKEEDFISKVVTQLFSSDTDPSDVCVDGYPINGYRRILARQIGLASQLLIQLFLVSPSTNSFGYKKCLQFYNKMLECCKTSLKRAALMRINIDNLKAFKNLKGSNNRHRYDENHLSNFGVNPSYNNSGNTSFFRESFSHHTIRKTFKDTEPSPSSSSSSSSSNIIQENISFLNDFSMPAASLPNVDSNYYNYEYSNNFPDEGYLNIETIRLNGESDSNSRIEKRLTRQEAASKTQRSMKSQQVSWVSMLDIPILNQSVDFIELVDFIIQKRPFGIEDKFDLINLEVDQLQLSYRDSINNHEKVLNYLNENTKRICDITKTPYFHCIAPSLKYPLTQICLENCFFEKYLMATNPPENSFQFCCSDSTVLNNTYSPFIFPMYPILPLSGSSLNIPTISSSSPVTEMINLNVLNYSSQFITTCEPIEIFHPYSTPSNVLENGIQEKDIYDKTNDFQNEKNSWNSSSSRNFGTDNYRTLLPDALQQKSSSSHSEYYFTPSEDGLLLRGIVASRELNWEKISNLYLPHKSPQVIMTHYDTMMSMSTSRRNLFKEYARLEVEARSRDTHWSHMEDIDLLRGFQIFGHKWALLSLFFLPHRKKKEIKFRWTSIQKQGWRREEIPQKSLNLPSANIHGLDQLSLSNQRVLSDLYDKNVNYDKKVVVKQIIDAQQNKSLDFLNMCVLMTGLNDRKVYTKVRKYYGKDCVGANASSNSQHYDFNTLTDRAKVFLHFLMESSYQDSENFQDLSKSDDSHILQNNHSRITRTDSTPLNEKYKTVSSPFNTKLDEDVLNDSDDEVEEDNDEEGLCKKYNGIHEKTDDINSSFDENFNMKNKNQAFSSNQSMNNGSHIFINSGDRENSDQPTGNTNHFKTSISDHESSKESAEIIHSTYPVIPSQKSSESLKKKKKVMKSRSNGNPVYYSTVLTANPVTEQLNGSSSLNNWESSSDPNWYSSFPYLGYQLYQSFLPLNSNQPLEALSSNSELFSIGNINPYQTPSSSLIDFSSPPHPVLTNHYSTSTIIPQKLPLFNNESKSDINNIHHGDLSENTLLKVNSERIISKSDIINVNTNGSEKTKKRNRLSHDENFMKMTIISDNLNQNPVKRKTKQNSKSSISEIQSSESSSNRDRSSRLLCNDMENENKSYECSNYQSGEDHKTMYTYYDSDNQLKLTNLKESTNTHIGIYDTENSLFGPSFST